MVFALSAPAYAHSQSGQGSHGGAGTSASNSTKGPMGPDKLKKTLSDAGFQNVRILDQSFLVQAQTKEGDDIIMLLNPPGPSNASTSNQSSGASGSGSSSPQSGSTGSGSSSSSSGRSHK